MVPAKVSRPRNPGPSWGYGFLNWCDRLLPRFLFRGLLWLGSGVALYLMPSQWRHSQAYLAVVLGRRPRALESWNHFFAFMESLMELFRLGRGMKHHFEFVNKEGGNFEALAASGEQALFGTFHFGNSDLLGYALSHYDRQVRMVRLKVENSNETKWLGTRFATHLKFIWVDSPENILFELKAAIQAGCTIAMKCDRAETSTKREFFRFLGERREFPITIYHLACVFNLPVAHCMGYPDGQGRTKLFASTVFRPTLPTRTENLEAGKVHFQETLDALELLLQKNPEWWYNFIPLNPTEAEVHLQNGAGGSTSPQATPAIR